MLQAAAGHPEHRGARLLFRHSLPLGQRGPTFHADLHSEFVQSLSARRRLLGFLGQDHVHRLEFSALDELTGLDILEAPSGEIEQWVLQALQQHPGTHTQSGDKTKSSTSGIGRQLF